MKKYIEIVDYIKAEVDTERFRSGDKMPSVRALAEMFSCSTLTVTRAYKTLEEEHLVYSVPKSGYYLVSKNKEAMDDQGVVDFSTILADRDILPYDAFNHCVQKATDEYKSELLSYGCPQGLSELIKTMRKELQNYQVFAQESQIFITSGAQQAVDLLCTMDFSNQKSKVLVEMPTYERLVSHLKHRGIEAMAIERTFEGIDLDELERIFRDEEIKFFYTVPRFHNPLGSSLNKEEKKKIVELAQQYDVFVVEDDYLADMDSDTRVDPIFAYDMDQRVIYLKTFAKVLMPGLRIAAVVLPEQLVEGFREAKSHSDLQTSILTQGALEIFIRSGMFKRSCAKLRNVCTERMDYLQQRCADLSMTGIKVNAPKTGLFLSMELAEPVNYPWLLSELEKKGVRIKDPRVCYIKCDEQPRLVNISVTRTSIEEIQRGMDILLETLLK